MSKICTICNTENVDEAKFCRKCGTKDFIIADKNIKDVRTDETKDEIYDFIADELASGNRKEGLWLKAISHADGDENSILALYTKYRVQAIQDEKEQSAIAEMKLEADKINFKADKLKDLESFLQKNNLIFIERISEEKIIAHYNGTSIDTCVQYNIVDCLWELGFTYQKGYPDKKNYPDIETDAAKLRKMDNIQKAEAAYKRHKAVAKEKKNLLNTLVNFILRRD